MKVALIVFALALSGVLSLPLDVDNPRFQLARDEGGKMHLVDINPADAEIEPAFDPEADMFFLLFTRSNPTVGQRITWTHDSVAQSNFRRGGQTRFLIHGWNGSSGGGNNAATTRNFLELGDYNVIVVDWGVGAQTPNYITARNRVGPTGAVLARLIDFFAQNQYTSYANVNVIGHSLGAHVAGHSGKNTQNGRINAIFGTDPAGPLFNINNPDDRLDVNDAEFTEAIHTNSGTLGFTLPITHISFYPNWGSSQPGCGTDVGGGCAHGRAAQFYSESVLSNRFVARQCTGHEQIVAENCPGTGVIATLGGDSQKAARGVFFLTTNAESPFAQG